MFFFILMLFKFYILNILYLKRDGDLRGIWKSGFCNCCESTTDCCIGFFVPCVEAGIAADKAGYGSLWAALQCLFYPLLVPVLRYQVRHEQRIDVLLFLF